jgi:hypothetical protein
VGDTSNQVLKCFDSLMFVSQDGLIYNGSLEGIHQQLKLSGIHYDPTQTLLETLQLNSSVINS